MPEETTPNTPSNGSYIAVAYGTLSDYEELVSQGKNDDNTIYFITDVNKIILNQQSYSGSDSLFDYKGHVSSADELPTEPTDKRGSYTDIYSVGDSYRLYIYDSETRKWVDLSKIPDGSITFSQLGDFVDVEELSEQGPGVKPSNRLPSTYAVKSYIKETVSDKRGQPNGFAALDSEGYVDNKIKCDDALISDSSNPVQNQVVSAALESSL